MKRLFWPALGVTAVVAFLVGLVAAGSHFPGFSPARSAARADLPPAAVPPSSPIPPAPAATVYPDFSKVVAAVQAGVVSVRAASRGGADARLSNRYSVDLDDPAAREEGGSGFVIDPAGGILTNYHVVAGADRVTVTFFDGRTLRASVVGVDEDIDIALLHVDAQDPLPTVPLGTSENLRVGQWVCAIGSPIGYANSVTVGVVSFLDRKIWQWNVDGVIQTDAAMSLGSSGSPLLDSAGEVVGITTAISVPSPNIGFAIPISQVVPVLSQLREWGRVSRGYLALGLTNLTPELRTALHVAAPRGALVQGVPADHAADRAGVRPYDVVVGVNGRAVDSDGGLLHMIAALRPGAVADLSIWRDGATISLPVKVEERPARPGSRGQAATVRTAAGNEQGPLGMTVRDLDATTIKNIPDGLTGVRVVDVDPAGPARLAKLTRGLLLVEINRHPTRSQTEFNAVVSALKPGTPAALLVFDPVLKEYSILSLVLDTHS